MRAYTNLLCFRNVNKRESEIPIENEIATLTFVQYKIQVKERPKKENDFCKNVNFVQISEAYSQIMKLL